MDTGCVGRRCLDVRLFRGHRYDSRLTKVNHNVPSPIIHGARKFFTVCYNVLCTKGIYLVLSISNNGTYVIVIVVVSLSVSLVFSLVFLLLHDTA